MKRVEIIVTGRVQGVGFRYFIEAKAKILGIKGHVRNLDYDKVEIVAEGKEENLNQFIELAKKGPTFARVTDTKINFEAATDEFKEFNIRF